MADIKQLHRMLMAHCSLGTKTKKDVSAALSNVWKIYDWARRRIPTEPNPRKKDVLMNVIRSVADIAAAIFIFTATDNLSVKYDAGSERLEVAAEDIPIDKELEAIAMMVKEQETYF